MGWRPPGSVNGDEEFDLASGRFEASICSLQKAAEFFGVAGEL